MKIRKEKQTIKKEKGKKKKISKYTYIQNQ